VKADIPELHISRRRKRRRKRPQAVAAAVAELRQLAKLLRSVGLDSEESARSAVENELPHGAQSESDKKILFTARS